MKFIKKTLVKINLGFGRVKLEDILKDLIPKLGIPSIVISIILIIVRLRPVTLLTANPIERKLLSKEKQFLIKAIKIVFETIITTIWLFFITATLFKSKALYNQYLALVLAIALIFGLTLIKHYLEVKIRVL